MPVSITLPDTLTERLQRAADTRKLPLDQFTEHLLDEALGHLAEGTPWDTLNRRRVSLVHKQATGPLSEGEEKELRNLQEAADRLLEPVDKLMLEQLLSLQSEAQRLSERGG